MLQNPYGIHSPLAYFIYTFISPKTSNGSKEKIRKNRSKKINFQPQLLTYKKIVMELYLIEQYPTVNSPLPLLPHPPSHLASHFTVVL